MSKHLRPKTDAERRTVIREAKAVYAFMSIGHGDDAIVKLRKVDAMEIVALKERAEDELPPRRGRDVTIEHAERRRVRCRNPEREVPQVLERSDQ